MRVLEEAVRRSEPLGVSAITLMEVASLASEGRVDLKKPIGEFFAELEASPVFALLPLTYEIAAESASLRVLRDPADRVIVATARVHRLKLVTSNQRIEESGLVQVVV